MASQNQYPVEKSGGHVIQPGDTHQYPPPPTEAAPEYQAPTGAPLHQFAAETPQDYFPPPPPGPPPHQQQYTTGGTQTQYPPPPTGIKPNQQNQPTTWVPAQNQQNTPTSAGAGATIETAHHGKLSAWDKTRNTSKAGFDKLWANFEKLGVPVNKLTNKIGSEAFWPQSLDKESNKCARILKSFCKDGFYSEHPTDPMVPHEGPKSRPKVLVKIPHKVIKNAVGLAIFTTMRTGLWVSGAGGSGVLIARLPDGSWSPPSGLLIHTAGVGFMAGIDIYDCVLVINTPEALAAFQKVRLSLGGEVSLAAGPVGIGGVGEFDIIGDRKRKPVWTYMKSRGLYAGVQIDGSIVIERNDENARFYGERMPAADILAGKMRSTPVGTRLLMEVLKEADGRQDVNATVLKEADEVPPPGDMEVEKGSEPSNDLKEKYGNESAARYA